jgi:hypothetical protein
LKYHHFESGLHRDYIAQNNTLKKSTPIAPWSKRKERNSGLNIQHTNFTISSTLYIAPWQSLWTNFEAKTYLILAFFHKKIFFRHTLKKHGQKLLQGVCLICQNGSRCFHQASGPFEHLSKPVPEKWQFFIHINGSCKLSKKAIVVKIINNKKNEKLVNRLTCFSKKQHTFWLYNKYFSGVISENRKSRKIIISALWTKVCCSRTAALHVFPSLSPSYVDRIREKAHKKVSYCLHHSYVFDLCTYFCVD